MNAPTRVISFTFTRGISGLTNMQPLHVRPLPIVPTRDTRASWPCASLMLVSGEV